MATYITFKELDLWRAKRHGSHRNDCKLFYGDMEMAHGDHDHITRLFTQYSNPIFRSDYVIEPYDGPFIKIAYEDVWNHFEVDNSSPGYTHTPCGDSRPDDIAAYAKRIASGVECAEEKPWLEEKASVKADSQQPVSTESHYEETSGQLENHVAPILVIENEGEIFIVDPADIPLESQIAAYQEAAVDNV